MARAAEFVCILCHMAFDEKERLNIHYRRMQGGCRELKSMGLLPYPITAMSNGDLATSGACKARNSEQIAVYDEWSSELCKATHVQRQSLLSSCFESEPVSSDIPRFIFGRDQQKPQPLRTVPRLDHRNWCLGQLDQFLLSDDLDTDSTSQSVQALLEFKTGAADAQMVNAIVHHGTGMCCDQTRDLRVCRACAPAHLFCEECAASTDHSVCWRNRADVSCVWCAQGVSCPVHCGL